MKLTRTIYTGCAVFYDDAAKMLPDVAVTAATGADGELVITDKCMMIVDAASGEAVGVLISREQAEELARMILAPSIEVVQHITGGILGLDGETEP